MVRSHTEVDLTKIARDLNKIEGHLKNIAMSMERSADAAVMLATLELEKKESQNGS